MKKKIAYTERMRNNVYGQNIIC